MTAPESLILEHLRAIRTDLTDVKERLSRVELNLSNLGQQMGASTSAVCSHQGDLEGLRRRVERIEQRLDLVDTAAD